MKVKAALLRAVREGEADAFPQEKGVRPRVSLGPKRAFVRTKES